MKVVGEGLDGFRFNAVIAQFYGFLNALRTHREAGGAQAERQAALKTFTVLISPFVPHLAEEAWARLGGEGMVSCAAWPGFDPALAADDAVVLPVQVNGKRRGEIHVPPGLAAAEVESLALGADNVARHLEGLTVRKVIVVPDRIVNIVAA